MLVFDQQLPLLVLQLLEISHRTLERRSQVLQLQGVLLLLLFLLHRVSLAFALLESLQAVLLVLVVRQVRYGQAQTLPEDQFSSLHLGSYALWQLPSLDRLLLDQLLLFPGAHSFDLLEFLCDE